MALVVLTEGNGVHCLLDCMVNKIIWEMGVTGWRNDSLHGRLLRSEDSGREFHCFEYKALSFSYPAAQQVHQLAIASPRQRIT